MPGEADAGTTTSFANRPVEPASVSLPAGLRARTLYREGMSLARISAETGLSPSDIYDWLDGGPPDAHDEAGEPLARIDRRRTPRPRRRRAPVLDRLSLVHRLWKAAERQATEIEARLRRPANDPVLSERDAKTLAVLARTVRELIAIDIAGSGPEMPAEESDTDDAIPRDLDALREALAIRIGQLRAERAAGAVGEAGSG